MASSEYWNRFWRTEISRRRLLKGSALAASGLAVAGVVGCGDDDDATGTPTGTAATATATATEGQPKLGGTIRGPLVGTSTGTPPSLDSQRQLTFLAQIPAAYHYNRLLKFVPPTPTMVNGIPSVPIDFSVVEGDAAEDVPEIVDGATFNFKIRDNLNFHDVEPLSSRAAGLSVTADDVKAAFDVFAAESPNRGNWLTQVEDVIVTGDKTLSIQLRGPFAPAFQVLFGNSDGGPWVIPPEVLEDEDLSNNKPIGAGPFIFESLTPDESIVWRKNPDYYDSPKPYLDGVETALTGDPEVILQNIKAGTFDSALWTATLWNRALDEVPDGQFFTGPEHVWGGAYFNFAEAPFNDKRVRQALSMAIDRPAILQALDEPGAVGGGSGLTHVSQFADFWLDPINDAAKFGANAKYYKRDVDAAKELLALAGYENGIDLTATTSVIYGPGFGDQMQAFGASAADAGFRMQFDNQEYGAYISTTFFGNLPENALGIAPLMGSPMDPHNIFFTIFHPTSARHNFGPQGDPHGIPSDQLPIAGDPGPSGDADLLAAWSAQAAELDTEARIEKVHDIQRMMAESMYFVPWTGTSMAFIYRPWVKGIRFSRGYAYGSETLPHIWLDR